MSAQTMMNELARVRGAMQALVLQAAADAGEIGFSRSHADGRWTVVVFVSGQVNNGGYAEEYYGPTRTIDELSLSELGHLVEEIETGNFARRAKLPTRDPLVTLPAWS